MSSSVNQSVSVWSVQPHTGTKHDSSMLSRCEKPAVAAAITLCTSTRGPEEKKKERGTKPVADHVLLQHAQLLSHRMEGSAGRTSCFIAAPTIQ